MPPAHTLNHFAAKLGPQMTNALDFPVQVVDSQLYTVPAAGRRLAAILQRLTGTCSARRVEEQAERSTFQQRKPGTRIHNLAETQHIAVKSCRRLCVIHDISHIHLIHWFALR